MNILEASSPFPWSANPAGQIADVHGRPVFVHVGPRTHDRELIVMMTQAAAIMVRRQWGVACVDGRFTLSTTKAQAVTLKKAGIPAFVGDDPYSPVIAADEWVRQHLFEDQR